MFNHLRSIIAGLLISISTFVSPVKQITPTPPPKISVTITSKATATIIPTPVVIATQPPQAQKCQFNKDGFINKAIELGYSEEEINTYLSAHPGNCINITKKTSVKQQNLVDPLPIPTLNVPTNKSCYRSGDYTFCSDGSSFITSGNLTIVNGGANGESGSCLKNGIYTSCSDGSSAIQSGNTSFINGGNSNSTCTRSGDWMFCSDGSSTYSPD